MRFTRTPYSLRKARDFRPGGIAAFLLFCLLQAAFVIHPLVHEHPPVAAEHEPCGHHHHHEDEGDSPEQHAESCLLAQCLSTPQITPEISHGSIALAVVERRVLRDQFLAVFVPREPAASRGPPAA